MLLEIMPDPRDVCRDFDAVDEAYTGDLAERRVRLLRRNGPHDGAHAPLLRVGLQRRRFAFDFRIFAPLPDELVNCGHKLEKCRTYRQRAIVNDWGAACQGSVDSQP